jgi:hypothetical protein
MIEQVRDVTVLHQPGGNDILFAFDVIGGIGPQPGDAVRAEPEDVGYFGARVVLAELLALGAAPLFLADLLTVPWQGPGERVVHGMRDLVADAGLGDLPVTGSTEENVVATATGAGFVAVGEATPGGLRYGLARPGDRIYLLGRPKSAPQDIVRRGDPEAVSLAALRGIVADERVKEVLPLGSRGLAHELGEIARRGLRPANIALLPQDLFYRSAGPATAVLLVADPLWQPTIGDAPILPLGRLEATRTGLPDGSYA